MLGKKIFLGLFGAGVTPNSTGGAKNPRFDGPNIAFFVTSDDDGQVLTEQLYPPSETRIIASVRAGPEAENSTSTFQTSAI